MKILVIVALLVALSQCLPTFPPTFILETDSLTANFTERIFYDINNGVRIDTRYRGEDMENHHVSTLYPGDGYRYTIRRRLFGSRVHPEFCFSEPQEMRGPHEFQPPKFISKINIPSVTVDGLPVDAWLVENGEGQQHNWWYTYNTSLNVQFLAGWSSPEDHGHVVTDFEFATPNVRYFEIPDCYTIYEQAPEKRALPKFVWPDSFTLTFKETNFERNLFVDGDATGYQRLETNVNIPDNLPYTRYSTARDGRTYHHEHWLNILPTPCFYETEQMDFWTPPDLTRIGKLNLRDPYPFDVDVYAHKGERSWWIVGNDSFPLGRVSSFREELVSEYSAYRPPAYEFDVPSTCYPAFVNMTFNKPLAGPVFPAGFTLYGIRSNYPHDLAINHDGKSGFTRIDIGEIGILQRGKDRYVFTVAPTNRISVLPCTRHIANTSLFDSPQFVRKVANATLDGTPVSVWNSYGNEPPPFRRLVHYWYLDADGTPAYETSYEGSVRVEYFQPTSPPPGVFDIPMECTLAPISQFNGVLPSVF